MKVCFHKYVDGFGGMGDGYVCVKCNRFTYWMPLLAMALGRCATNDGTLMHRDSFPYVVKFDQQVSSVPDIEKYPYHFNKRGILSVTEEGPDV